MYTWVGLEQSNKLNVLEDSDDNNNFVEFSDQILSQGSLRYGLLSRGHDTDGMR